MAPMDMEDRVREYVEARSGVVVLSEEEKKALGDMAKKGKQAEAEGCQPATDRHGAL